MSGVVDTSMIVRYLTGDPPDLAEVSAEMIDGVAPLLVTDVVIVETAYVLMSVYEVPRAAVVDGLIALLSKANIDTFRLGKDLALEALMHRRPAGRVSFADALVWGAGRSQANAAVCSLDEGLSDQGLAVMQYARSGSMELGNKVDRPCERNGRTGSQTRLIDRSAGPSRDQGIDRRPSGAGQSASWRRKGAAGGAVAQTDSLDASHTERQAYKSRYGAARSPRRWPQRARNLGRWLRMFGLTPLSSNIYSTGV